MTLQSEEHAYVENSGNFETWAWYEPEMILLQTHAINSTLPQEKKLKKSFTRRLLIAKPTGHWLHMIILYHLWRLNQNFAQRVSVTSSEIITND